MPLPKKRPDLPWLQLLILASLIGLVGGMARALREAWASDWFYYGLTKLVPSDVAARSFAWMRACLVVALIALGFRRLLSAVSRSEAIASRRFSLYSALVAGAAVALYLGFYTNRYTYKIFWRRENFRPFLGLEVPAALVMPKLLLVNGAIVLAGIVVALVARQALRHLLPGLLALQGRRSLTWAGALAAGLLVVVMVMASPASSQDRPNIILISIDTLRADHLQSYGYPLRTSPNIEALAGGGVLFENAISQANWTLPSHMSIMTSQIPRSHTVQTVERRLPRYKVTLAEVLKNAGYATAAFTGGFNVDARFGFDQGFDLYYGDRVYHLRTPERIQYRKGLRLSYLLPRIFRWLSKHDQRPFFLFIHCWDTHSPFLPHEGHIEEFSPDYTGSIPVATTPLINELSKNPQAVPEADRRRIRALYDNEIRNVDDTLQQLFDELRRRDLFDRSIIVFTSDHGEELFEHGVGHGKFLYEQEVHVPLILSYPAKVPAGQRIADVVRSIDIAPTLLELANVDYPEAIEAEFQGMSFAGIWDGQDEDRLAFSEGKGERTVSIRNTRYKFVVTASAENDRISEELFDLIEDPAELADRHLLEPRTAARMRDEMERYLRNLPAVRFATHFEETALDEDFIEQLKSLGYLQ